MTTDIQVLKERWVKKHFGDRRTTREVLRALDRFERREAKLANEEQPQLGIEILRAYLADSNKKKLKEVCREIPAQEGEHARAIRRIRNIVKYPKRRYVWSYY